jgi:hypothetical protein
MLYAFHPITNFCVGSLLLVFAVIFALFGSVPDPLLLVVLFVGSGFFIVQFARQYLHQHRPSK